MEMIITSEAKSMNVKMFFVMLLNGKYDLPGKL